MTNGTRKFSIGDRITRISRGGCEPLNGVVVSHELGRNPKGEMDFVYYLKFDGSEEQSGAHDARDLLPEGKPQEYASSALRGFEHVPPVWFQEDRDYPEEELEDLVCPLCACLHQEDLASILDAMGHAKPWPADRTPPPGYCMSWTDRNERGGHYLCPHYWNGQNWEFRPSDRRKLSRKKDLEARILE